MSHKFVGHGSVAASGYAHAGARCILRLRMQLVQKETSPKSLKRCKLFRILFCEYMCCRGYLLFVKGNSKI